ncbi:GNAT family N-acetyltransferase, partial [Maribellus luteus]
ADGANRFDGQGEALFAAFVDGELAGVGGVSAETGLAAMRMRRLYVRPSFRRRGVASALAAAMIQQGLQGARLLTVNAAASLAAPPFWEALGFRRSGRAGVTHQLDRERPFRVRGVEQRAVRAVVQVKGVALAQLDLGQHRGALGDQRAAGLAPQLGGLVNHHLGEAAMDGVGVVAQVRRDHARIDRREAAAHVDHVGEDAGADE